MIFLLPVLAPIVSGIASGLTITASAAEIAAVATVVTATGAATAEVIKAAKDKEDKQVAKIQVCGQPVKNREKKPVIWKCYFSWNVAGGFLKIGSIRKLELL